MGARTTPVGTDAHHPRRRRPLLPGQDGRAHQSLGEGSAGRASSGYEETPRLRHGTAGSEGTGPFTMKPVCGSAGAQRGGGGHGRLAGEGDFGGNWELVFALIARRHYMC